MSMTWGHLSELLGKNSIEKRVPMIGEFELTPRCNLSCKMCYICRRANDKEALLKERSAKEWINLALEARDAGLLFLLLTGGEIFLRNDFKTIYEELSMMGFSISMYTNGTLITPKIASWLGRIAPSQIDVTLYGATPETYGKLCGDPTGFDRAINGIELLLSQGINLQLRTTIVRENINEFDALCELTDMFGLNLGVVNYISPRREGEHISPEGTRLLPTELAVFEEKVYSYYSNKYQHEEEAEQDINDFLPNMDRQVTEFMNCFNDSFPCSSAKNSFLITWDGRMVPCSLMDKPEAFPFKYGFLPSWKELRQLCSTVPSCKDCITCSLASYCDSCPANLMNESGSYLQKAPYLCQLAKERKALKDKKIIQNTTVIAE